jgi:AraC-like DNA-binding protein
VPRRPPDYPVPRRFDTNARGVRAHQVDLNDIAIITSGSMWEQRRWKLSPGPFSARWTQVLLAHGVVVMHERSQSSQRVQLGAKLGFLCIGFYAGADGPMLLAGREIAADEPVLITPGATFDSTIPGGMNAVQLYFFPEAHDMLWVNEPERERLLKQWSSVGVAPLRGDPEHAASLHRLLTDLAAVREWPGAWADVPGQYLADQAAELTSKLLSSAVPREPDPEVGRPSLRRMAAMAAEKYLLEASDRPVSTLELCRHTGVSERTLQAAMIDQFGQSPMAYMRTIRLAQVHAALREAKPGDTVQAISLRFGFLHQGRFSAQYREQFGETPGQTLRRHAGGEAVADE